MKIQPRIGENQWTVFEHELKANKFQFGNRIVRTFFMDSTAMQQELLSDFVNIHSIQSASEWVSRYGSPIPYTKRSSDARAVLRNPLKLDFLLSAAESWRWFRDLALWSSEPEPDFNNLMKTAVLIEVNSSLTPKQEETLPPELIKVARAWSTWTYKSRRLQDPASQEISFLAFTHSRPKNKILFGGMEDRDQPFSEYFDKEDPHSPLLLSDFVEESLVVALPKDVWQKEPENSVVHATREYLRRLVNYLLQSQAVRIVWSNENKTLQLRSEIRISCPWDAMALGLRDLLLQGFDSHKPILCQAKCGSLIKSNRSDTRHCGSHRCAKWVQRHCAPIRKPRRQLNSN